MEPNDAHPEANGPLCSGQGYLGYPDDVEDWFFVYLPATVLVEITLTGHTGDGVQLLLYNQALQLVCLDNTPPEYQINAGNCPSQPAGRYYLRIYTASGWNYMTPYTLHMSFP